MPLLVETFEGRLRIDSEASMRDWFNRNVDFYDIIGVTDMQRRKAGWQAGLLGRGHIRQGSI